MNKKLLKKTFAGLLALLLAVGAMPLAAAAQQPATEVAYLDKYGIEQICPAAKSYAGDTALTTGWYCATGTLTVSSRVTITGDVHLILADGCDVTIDGGINVAPGNSLAIYAQSTGAAMGKLQASAVDKSAGIGGNADIGGNAGEGCGTVDIMGGSIVAASGYAPGGVGSGAGIGGGGGGTGIDGGAGGTVTIWGGSVVATGGAASGGSGAGIGGGGGGGSGEGGGGGTVVIWGGSVVATGGNSGYGSGAGIGGGGGAGSGGAGGTVTIRGGVVEATGGISTYAGPGAGIGGGGGGVAGAGGAGAVVDISFGVVTASGGTGTGGLEGKGIGAGLNGSGTSGTLGSTLITGGSVLADPAKVDAPQNVNGTAVAYTWKDYSGNEGKIVSFKVDDTAGPYQYPFMVPSDGKAPLWLPGIGSMPPDKNRLDALGITGASAAVNGNGTVTFSATIDGAANPTWKRSESADMSNPATVLSWSYPEDPTNPPTPPITEFVGTTADALPSPAAPVYFYQLTCGDETLSVYSPVLAVPTPSVASLAANAAVLPATGGDSTLTLAGAHLPAGITVTAFDEATQTAITGETTGSGRTGTVTLQGFAANTTAVAKTYTVKISPDGGATYLASPTATVTVSAAPPISSVTVAPKSASVQKGQTQQFGAVVQAADGVADTVTWAVAGNTSAQTSITQSGLLTVGADETATGLTVTATADADTAQADTATVTVTASVVPVQGITVTGGNAITTKGGSVQLSADVSPDDATNKAVAWASSNTAIATVDASGLVTAVANGSVAITATAQDGSNVAGTLSLTVSGQAAPVPPDPPDPPAPKKYAVLSSFMAFAGGGESQAKIDADKSKFERLLYKNAEVDTQHYSITHGSTVITLKESYLKTFANGTHTFRAEFTDGYAELKLVVNVPAASTAGAASPQTGDENHMGLWIAMLLAAGVGIIGAGAFRRRRCGSN